MPIQVRIRIRTGNKMGRSSCGSYPKFRTILVTALPVYNVFVFQISVKRCHNFKKFKNYIETLWKKGIVYQLFHMPVIDNDPDRPWMPTPPIRIHNIALKKLAVHKVHKVPTTCTWQLSPGCSTKILFIFLIGRTIAQTFFYFRYFRLFFISIVFFSKIEPPTQVSLKLLTCQMYSLGCLFKVHFRC